MATIPSKPNIIPGMMGTGRVVPTPAPGMRTGGPAAPDQRIMRTGGNLPPTAAPVARNGSMPKVPGMMGREGSMRTAVPTTPKLPQAQVMTLPKVDTRGVRMEPANPTGHPVRNITPRSPG